jgi:hypothetical protein
MPANSDSSWRKGLPRSTTIGNGLGVGPWLVVEKNGPMSNACRTPTRLRGEIISSCRAPRPILLSISLRRLRTLWWRWLLEPLLLGLVIATPTFRCASCHLLYVFASRAEPSASSQTSRYGVGVTTGVGEVRMAVLAVAPASRFRNVTAMIAVLSGSEIVPLIVRI